MPVLLLSLLGYTAAGQTQATRCVGYTVDPSTSDIQFYWKNDQDQPLRSIGNLRAYLAGKNRVLQFAMNGGMYMENRAPLGLFIQEGKTLRKLNTASAEGNFYLKPNGVFYITDGKRAHVCNTTDFRDDGHIRFATQSGPLLLVDGNIHPKFRQGSTNLNIRNGVSILPDGRVLFAISRVPVNFYDFALYFKEAGCKNALFLDGFVSRMYLPEKNWLQTDGNFGVMIGVSVPKK